MNEEDRQKLREHDKRVRQLAKKMPTAMLRRAVKAIGYPADKDTGQTSGFSLDTLVKELRRRTKGRESMSLSSLKRAIPILEANDVIQITRQRSGDRNETSIYTIDFDWDGTIDMDFAEHREHLEYLMSIEPSDNEMAEITSGLQTQPCGRVHHPLWDECMICMHKTRRGPWQKIEGLPDFGSEALDKITNYDNVISDDLDPAEYAAACAQVLQPCGRRHDAWEDCASCLSKIMPEKNAL